MFQYVWSMYRHLAFEDLLWGDQFNFQSKVSLKNSWVPVMVIGCPYKVMSGIGGRSFFYKRLERNGIRKIVTILHNVES